MAVVTGAGAIGPGIVTESKINTILRNIKSYKSRMKRLRDPVAHPGGMVEILANPEHIGSYILLVGNIGIVDILDSFKYRKQTWSERAKHFTEVIRIELDEVCRNLSANLA